jgi:hypothetical protein
MTRTFIILLLCLAIAPWSARADDASEAQLQYELGVELYRQRRFTEALERFLASNRLVPNANVTFNIAQTYGLIGRPIEAYNWYESNLVEFELDAERRAQGVTARDALQSQVAIVEVTTTPPGAQVYVDRVDLGAIGRSPRRVAMAAGDHRLVARLEGFREASTPITARQGEVVPAALALERLTGTLRVESTPAGAAVSIEGEATPLGRTPFEAPIPVGDVVLLVRLDGYVEERRTVRIAEGAPVPLRVSLRRDPSRLLARLEVSGEPAGAAVIVDGRRIGATPLSEPEMAPGARRIEVRAAARSPWTGRVTLEPGGETRLRYMLADPDDTTWGGWSWLGYVGGSALVVTGAVLGYLAATASGQFYDWPVRPASDPPTHDEIDTVHRLSLMADVLSGAGLLTLVVTVIWDLLRPDDPVSHARVLRPSTR